MLKPITTNNSSNELKASGKRGGCRNPILLEAAASRVQILKYGFGYWVSTSVQAAFHPVPLEAYFEIYLPHDAPEQKRGTLKIRVQPFNELKARKKSINQGIQVELSLTRIESISLQPFFPYNGFCYFMAGRTETIKQSWTSPPELEYNIIGDSTYNYSLLDVLKVDFEI